jgi:glycerol-3-phosphate dehydrogenase
MSDIGGATSSSSTKLFHGGLRYLEYFEFRLVRESLIEREVLLKMMPHISWPMRFVLPLSSEMRFENSTPTSRLLNFLMPWAKGKRPAWLIRLGLFLYDNLGGRKILPGTSSISLSKDVAGDFLQKKFKKAFEYSDCWIEDNKLVALNALDAKNYGAKILTRTKVIKAKREEDLWNITIENQRTKEVQECHAKVLINAAGPWVADVINTKLQLNSKDNVRLVRGSHIVVPRLYDHDKCYFFQGTDGRIIFSIPYEYDFTLIGTTDADHDGIDTKPTCSDTERDYLVNFASQYFAMTISSKDVVWSYSGVRPLYDDGTENASAATRDYVLKLEYSAGNAPLLNIFGGKITTYRKLAEAAIAEISSFFPNLNAPWTANSFLPGGNFAVEDVAKLIEKLRVDFSFLTEIRARRLIRSYGLNAWEILKGCKKLEDLGEQFGDFLTQKEVDYMRQNEFAIEVDDIIWRRTKLGLRMSDSDKKRLSKYLKTS